jgi:hypothetical protein
MPLVEDAEGKPKWLDSTQPDRLRISLNTQKTGISGLSETGEYEFQFQVIVPAQIPNYNVWTVSLCKGNGGCITSGDSAVQLVMPIPGFKHNEVSSLFEDEGASSAWTISPFGMSLLPISFIQFLMTTVL